MMPSQYSQYSTSAQIPRSIEQTLLGTIACGTVVPGVAPPQYTVATLHNCNVAVSPHYTEKIVYCGGSVFGRHNTQVPPQYTIFVIY